jgi:nucleotide-binding universal stress UspA family protein
MAGRFAHILVPTDFSPASDAALACAKELAQTFEARLSLLHVITNPEATGMWTPDVFVPASEETRDRLIQQARQRLEEALSADERAKFKVAIEAPIGSAAEGIQEFAREQHVDLIVMGTHGRRGLSHMLLGSVAERMVRTATCPVLTTHAAPHPEARAEAIAAALV